MGFLSFAFHRSFGGSLLLLQLLKSTTTRRRPVLFPVSLNPNAPSLISFPVHDSCCLSKTLLLWSPDDFSWVGSPFPIFRTGSEIDSGFSREFSRQRYVAFPKRSGPQFDIRPPLSLRCWPPLLLRYPFLLLGLRRLIYPNFDSFPPYYRGAQ